MKKLILSFTILTLFACKTEQRMPENFDYGSIENGVYANDYFQMHFPFDDSWDVQSQDEVENIQDLGQDIITDENIKRAIKASEINTANLFVAYVYEFGSTMDYNPSLMIVAENIKMFPQVKRGRDYLIEAQKILNGTSLNYSYDMILEPKVINGKSFDVMNATGSYLGNEFKQKYMSTVTDGFCLSIIISYDTDNQRELLEKALEQMTFNTAKSKKKN